MSVKLQLLILLTVFIIGYLLINMMRKEKVMFKHMIPWFGILVLITIVTIFPSLIDISAYLIGVKTPINAVFFMAIMILILIILPLSFSNTKLSIKQIRLIQEAAILEKEIRDIKGMKGEIDERNQ